MEQDVRSVDPLERRIELAFQPGTFIHDRVCFEFMHGLEVVEAEITRLNSTDPVRATILYETLLAACHEKAQEVDDSSGCFGQFAAGVICGWIAARQSSASDPDETASRLLTWIDDNPYGFCYHIERDVARALNSDGLAAFERQVRSRFDASAAAMAARSQWSEVLRTVYIEQNNVAAYVEITQQTALTPQDCHAIAKIINRAGRPDEALTWVERGIALDHGSSGRSWAGGDLKKLQRELLAALGRDCEALESAWADFQASPSKYTFGDLMEFVPELERQVWKEKALDAAGGADLRTRIELLVEANEMERLAELVRDAADETLEDLSHYVTEPAAEKLEPIAPGLAARLWRAQGMRILNRKKSKYYDSALSNFARAKDCYERAGLDVEWERTARHVATVHHRKFGFLSRFGGVVRGTRPRVEPTFLERARARWSGRQGRPIHEEQDRQ